MENSAQNILEPTGRLPRSKQPRLPKLTERFLSLRLNLVLWPIGLALVVLLIWEVLVTLLQIPEVILPPPSEVFGRLAENYDLILRQAVPTTVDTLVAFGISIPLGVALAFLITTSDIARKAVYPNVILFQLIPKIALAPLFIVWLGIGSTSRVTFAVFICFFPILVSTAIGLESVSRDIVRMCRSLGATDRQVLLQVRLPTALPHLFGGMKVAVTLAIIGVVVGEFIASQAGLGYLILFASSRQDTALTLACILVLCGVGLALYGLVVLSERLLSIWFGDH